MKFFLKPNNIMIDLETFSLESNAYIVSIGACKFFTEITDTFYKVIDVKSTPVEGFDLDISTIQWWMGQSDEARQTLLTKDAIPLNVALGMLAAWIGEDAAIWGNGAAFDNVVLKNAYKNHGIEVPWPHINDMCFRTMRAMFPSNDSTWSGTAHNAKDDAIWQTKTLINIFRQISSN